MAPSGSSISMKYIIFAAALIGTIQAVAWLSLSLISILFYESVIEIGENPEDSYENIIYNLYLNKKNLDNNYIIYPKTFNYFMYIYLGLSFVWLIASCVSLWGVLFSAVIREKWNCITKQMIFWLSITIAIAITDMVLMGLVAADLQKAHDLDNHTSVSTTSIATTTNTITVPTSLTETSAIDQVTSTVQYFQMSTIDQDTSATQLIQDRSLEISKITLKPVDEQMIYTSMGIVMTVAARGYILWIVNVTFAIMLIVLVQRIKKMNRPTLLPAIDAYATGIVLLLWVLCVAVSEHQKRDVHRIVIKERAPRSHKKGHGHGHTHKGHNRKNKKGKNPHKNHESDSSSYEDSKENSYEDIFYGRQMQKPNYKKKTSQNRPVYPKNLEMEESRHHHYKEGLKPHSENEWVPLNTEQVLQHSQENYRNKDKRKNRRENKTKSRKPKTKETNPLYILEHTTSYPLLHFDTSTLYPPLSVFPGTFSNYNGKLLESYQSPLLSTFEQPKLDFSHSKDNSDRLRNHRTSYDVKEADESDIGTFILVPDSNFEGNADEQELKYKLRVMDNQKSTRNGGSIALSQTTNF